MPNKIDDRLLIEELSKIKLDTTHIHTGVIYLTENDISQVLAKAHQYYQQKIEEIRPYLEDCIEITRNYLGEWDCVERVHRPSWTKPLSDIEDLIQEVLKKQWGIK